MQAILYSALTFLAAITLHTLFRLKNNNKEVSDLSSKIGSPERWERIDTHRRKVSDILSGVDDSLHSSDEMHKHIDNLEGFDDL